MSASVAPIYVQLDTLGGVWQVVGVRDGIATLRHTTALTDFPGHPAHGKPAEVHCPLRATIPAAGTPAVVDAPAEAWTGTAGASSPSAGGTPVTVAALGTVAAVAPPPTAATPSHRGARNTDPDTSLEAAEAITDLRRRADHDMVLHLLALHGPLTDFDLARHVSTLTGHTVGQTSIGVRRGELRNAGLVCDSGFKGKSPSGARSIRWALTAQGAEVAA